MLIQYSYLFSVIKDGYHGQDCSIQDSRELKTHVSNSNGNATKQ